MPTVAVAGGVPEIVGGWFAALTVIANAGSAADALPSLTLITMLLCVCAALGVPCSAPVLILNVAQVGRLLILNVSVPPSGSFAVGVNAYAVPTVAVVGGVPEIVGGWFAALTMIENAGNDADALPSLTLITMLP